jgi:hypothetical protein
MPTRGFQCSRIPSIAHHIALALLCPEFRSGQGGNSAKPAFMTMPETAMNKNDSFVFWQNYIWLAGKIFSVQAKPISQGVQDRPNLHFRLRVLSSDCCHVSAALLTVMNISHKHLLARSLSIKSEGQVERHRFLHIVSAT